MAMIALADDAYIGMAEDWIYNNYKAKKDREWRLEIVEDHPKHFVRKLRIYKTKQSVHQKKGRKINKI